MKKDTIFIQFRLECLEIIKRRNSNKENCKMLLKVNITEFIYEYKIEENKYWKSERNSL